MTKKWSFSYNSLAKLSFYKQDSVIENYTFGRETQLYKGNELYMGYESVCFPLSS